MTHAAAPADRIGPNAILQLVPVIEARGGPGLLEELLGAAGIRTLPDGTAMIDEREAARLHQALRGRLPGEAASIATEAGAGTADYILAHRIPGFAKALMRAAPAPLAARMLSGAIARHAWTFAGSGDFMKISPYVFEIADNPVVRGEHAPGPICDWHAAVFTRLYRVLVSARLACRETACCAAGAPACRFEIAPG